MRVPIVSGILADNSAEFLQSYPVNLEVVPVDNKIASAQYRSASGATIVSTGPGIDRGGVTWRNDLYRVMGTKFCKVGIDGTITVLGDVGGTGPVTLDYSFDHVIIRSGTNLFYWDPVNGVVQVTDPNLGVVVDAMWIDGYTMTTDGNSIVVTELADPTAILPLDYGSAEEDPDRITGLLRFRDEAYILGQNTIQVLENVGGNGFPFIDTKVGTIPVGCIGAMAKCLFSDSFAFCGSARNEALGIYIAGNGTATRISTRAIDDELAKVADPTTIILENRTYRQERRLLVHLPDKTLVYQLDASRILEQEVWHVLQSGLGDPYRIRYAVQAYGAIWVGDTQTSSLGKLDDTVSTHFGDLAQYTFDVGLIYNQARGGMINKLELVGLPGHAPFSADPSIWLSMTKDGQTFSVERAVPGGKAGERDERLQWRPRTNFRNWIGLRFRGYSSALPGFTALEADITPLAS